MNVHVSAPSTVVIPGLAIGEVGSLTARGQAKIDHLALQLGLSVATGTDIGDLWMPPITQGNVVYVSAGESADALSQRIKTFVADPSTGLDGIIPTNFRVLLDDRTTAALFENDNGAITAHPDLDAIASLAQKHQARLLVLDGIGKYLDRAHIKWDIDDHQTQVIEILRSTALNYGCGILFARSHRADHRPIKTDTTTDIEFWLDTSNAADTYLLTRSSRGYSETIIETLKRNDETGVFTSL